MIAQSKWDGTAPLYLTFEELNAIVDLGGSQNKVQSSIRQKAMDVLKIACPKEERKYD